MKNLLVTAVVALGLCFSSTVQAQEFNNVNMTSTKVMAKKKCAELQGAWEDVPVDKDFPLKNLRITSAAFCTLPSQLVKELPDHSYDLVRPASIFFVFDHVDLIELAIFNYDFSTWAARVQATLSVKKNMNTLFPLTTTRLDVTEYRLNNLPRYFTFLTTRKTTSFELGLAISRDRFLSYVGD